MICPNETFHCSTNGCLSWDYVCDGIEQCPSGDDETFCGQCTNNKYTCVDGIEMSCDLSCSVLGFIPCTKYRNRRTCALFYPNAIGSYKSGLMYKQNLFTSLFYDSSSRMIYISGAISTLILLLIIVFLVILFMRKKSLFFKLTKALNDKTRQQEKTPTTKVLNNFTVIHNKLPENSYEREDDLYYEEHKYQEIPDLDDDNGVAAENQSMFYQAQLSINDATKATTKKPPHMTYISNQNYSLDKKKIKGKSTYV